MASLGTVDAGKRRSTSVCPLCKGSFRDNNVLRAHVIKEHGRTYSSKRGKSTDFLGTYRNSTESDQEWARDTLGHRSGGMTRGKLTPYTPRSSAFSPLGRGSYIASPTSSLASGYSPRRRASLDSAPDAVAERMKTQIVSLRRHAMISSSESSGRESGDSERPGRPSFRTPEMASRTTPALPRTSPATTPQLPRPTPHYPALPRTPPRTTPAPHYPALPRTTPHYPVTPRNYPALPRNYPLPRNYQSGSTSPWNSFDLVESLITEGYFYELNRSWLQSVLTQSLKLLKTLLQYSQDLDG